MVSNQQEQKDMGKKDQSSQRTTDSRDVEMNESTKKNQKQNEIPPKAYGSDKDRSNESKTTGGENQKNNFKDDKSPDVDSYSRTDSRTDSAKTEKQLPN